MLHKQWDLSLLNLWKNEGDLVSKKETVPKEAEVKETKAAKKETAKAPKEDKATALEEQLKQQQEQYQRVLAEYANYKRRTEQEKKEIGQFAKGELLEKFLPLIDNLNRATEAPDGPEYRKGVEMINRQMHELLTTVGVEEIDALGKPFDPNIHFAVMREDAADGVEPDTVTAVLQTGYIWGDKVLRPAMVKVAN